MTSTAILLAAADRLEKPGAWCQGDEGGAADSAMCLIRAVSVEADTAASRSLAMDALRNYLGRMYPHEWNDAPGRTQAEVVEALREAAKEK